MRNALIISEFINNIAGYLWFRIAANNGSDSEIVIDDGINNASQE